MSLFFDGLIILFLIVDVALMITLIHQILHLTRRERPAMGRCFICVVVVLLALVAGGLVAYGSFIEPRLLMVHEESIALQGDGAQQMRMAFVSDFHAGSYLSEGLVKRVVREINAQAPDVVLLGGDFVSFGETEAVSMLAPLKDLAAPYGVYAVLGNHDYSGDVSEMESALAGLGINLLKNKNVVVGEGDARLAVAGVDDLWFGTVDLANALAGIPDGVPRILLAHNPDIVYALGDHHVDAILSGHTHGGQLRLPGIGPLTPLPTALGWAYDRGVFKWYETPFVITQGIGVVGPRARLFVPPEIMMLTVTY